MLNGHKKSVQDCSFCPCWIDEWVDHDQQMPTDVHLGKKRLTLFFKHFLQKVIYIQVLHNTNLRVYNGNVQHHHITEDCHGLLVTSFLGTMCTICKYPFLQKCSLLGPAQDSFYNLLVKYFYNFQYTNKPTNQPATDTRYFNYVHRFCGELMRLLARRSYTDLANVYTGNSLLLKLRKCLRCTS